MLSAFALALMLQAAPVAGWTDSYVYGNGIRIHYWHAANPGKPVMIFAHGSSDDGLCWTGLAKELTSGYDIYLVDARGHGLTDPPKVGDGPDAQVEDLAAFIRERKIVKPILMGHSMGSSSVAWFSSRYPDVPKAVILEDPGLAPRRPGAPAPGAAQGTPEERIQKMIERNNMSLEELTADCMKNSPKWGEDECRLWAPSKRRHHPATTQVGMAGRPPMTEILPKITAPTLILKADAQGDLRKQNEETAALLPKGKIVHIDGAGHNVRRENKPMALATLKAFLAGLN
ncbi:alpha/beta fold hydrolase [Paludibaculum fermentans]|uniref:alpha/beta fold hydrolase n=1 Tax=Paludibaculum fermentans TaxID=1473598 RepID=UPI003EBB6F72